MQRATVTICIHRVRNAYANHAALAIRRVGGYGFGDRGAAGICVTEGHYVVAAGSHTRDQNRCLVRFRSGAGKKTLLQISRRNLCDFLSQSYDVFVRIKRGGVLRRFTWALILLVTLGLQWPTETVRMPPKKSRYLRPSRSQRYCISPRSATSGR